MTSLLKPAPNTASTAPGAAMPDRATQFHPRPTSRGAMALPVADRRHLERHLKSCEGARQRSWPLLAHVLHYKIMSTECAEGDCPADLVRGGSLVTYSVDGGAEAIGLLTHWAREGAGGGVIPVASLLGATLIGMRVGQRAPLLNEDGTIGSLAVLGVVPLN